MTKTVSTVGSKVTANPQDMQAHQEVESPPWTAEQAQRWRQSHPSFSVWRVLMAQVLVASAVFGGLLWFAAGHWDWTGLQAQAWTRAGLMLGVTSGGVVVYFAILKGLGVDLRALWRR